MNSANPGSGSTGHWNGLKAIGLFGEPEYRSEDYAELLTELLSSRLCEELEMTEDEISGCQNVNPPIQSFLDAILHPSSPLLVLKRIKDYAKLSKEDDRIYLPEAIATTIYYASIVAAYVHHGEIITDLKKDIVIGGCKWAIDQLWMDAKILPLFKEGLQSFQSD